MPTYDMEKSLISKGYNVICGVDEAGRGPLAGPVFAAATVLNLDDDIEGLDDSKKLSEKKREQLFDIIRERAVCFAVASASVEEIERLNILGATMLAMTRAVDMLPRPADYAIIDGNKVPSNLDGRAVSLVKGDALSMSVAAASVLAKVSRDRYMKKQAEEYPEYNFAKSKGYGTKEHIELIKKYGPCPLHRPSFLKKILG